MSKLKLEICVDTIESALAAEMGGADRIELCSALSEGGLTPSAGIISNLTKVLKIEVNVLIRPRRGDFLYSELEIECMKHDISMAKNLGAHGVVLGVLKKDGNVDMETMQDLIALARPLSVTFHRAFDMVPDPIKALDDLFALKVDRLLTSGQQQGAEAGMELIAQLVRKANNKLIIMPGGGITESNIQKIQQITGASEFHGSARVKKESPMEYRKKDVLMSGSASLSEYELMETSEVKVREMKRGLLG